MADILHANDRTHQVRMNPALIEVRIFEHLQVRGQEILGESITKDIHIKKYISSVKMNQYKNLGDVFDAYSKYRS